MEKIYDLQLPADKTASLDLSSILDEEKLLHLHPHWFVNDFRQENGAAFASLRDHATDREFRLGLRLGFPQAFGTVPNPGSLMRVALSDCPVNELVFFIDQQQLKVRLKADALDEEMEQSMLLWLRAIQAYMRLYLKATPYTLFFRALMNRMILQMNPSQRKICMMITKITAVELLVIVIIVVGYVFFVQ